MRSELGNLEPSNPWLKYMTGIAFDLDIEADPKVINALEIWIRELPRETLEWDKDF